MPLPEPHKRHLRKLGHHLKPVVIVGQSGVTEAVLAEIDASLLHHELIKLRINAAQREQRADMAKLICERLAAQAVHAIGHTVLIFRRNPDRPRIVLPSIRKAQPQRRD